MKKIFALALAIVMMMAIALPTFAAVNSEKYGDVDGDDAAASQIYSDNMLLEYGVSQTYTVTIPADITFENTADKLKAERTVSVSDVIIAGNEYIKVDVMSKHGWKMVDYQDGTVDTVTDETMGPSTAVNYWYGIDEEVSYAYGETQFSGTDSIINIPAQVGNNGLLGTSKSVVLHFGTRGTAQEGTFKDFLTFKVEVYVPQTNG